MNILGRSLIGLFVLAALAGCSTPFAAAPTPTPDPCSTDVLAAYADTIGQQLNTFEQQAQLVGSTPRVSMGAPMQRLLDIQTETSKLAVPPCLSDYHSQILMTMQFYQTGYQNFAAQGAEIDTQAHILAGEEMMQRSRASLVTIKAGTVPPTSVPVPTAGPMITVIVRTMMVKYPRLSAADVGMISGPIDVPALATTVDSGGNQWFLVRYNQLEGWIQKSGVSSSVIDALPTVTPEP